MRFGKGDHFTNVVMRLALFSALFVAIAVLNPFEGVKVWSKLIISLSLCVLGLGSAIGEIVLWKMELEKKDDASIKKTRRITLAILCTFVVLLIVTQWF